MKKLIFVCLLVLCLAPLSSVKAATTASVLKQKLMGRIVVAVQTHGDIYYVNPKDKQTYLIGSSASALSMLAKQGVGISEKDYKSLVASKAKAKKLAGRIVLRTQAHGEAYYINPVTFSLNFMGSQKQLAAIIKSYGRNVNDADLAALLSQNGLIDYVTYKNTKLGFQISVPSTWVLPSSDSSAPEFFSTASCSQQLNYFDCPSFKIILSAYYPGGMAADFTNLQNSADNPIKLPYLISGASVIEANNRATPTPGSDNTNWAKAYDIFFQAQQKYFVFYTTDQSFEKGVLPTLKLTK